MFTAVLIVPTGIGASIGGYAGDALPVAKAMTQVVDRLITHPNVMNGAQLYWSDPKIEYVEGYALDRFAHGEWGLQSVIQNRIGVVFDRGIEEDLRLRNIQAIEAVRATLGINVTHTITTDYPLEVQLRQSDSGASWGTIGRPDSLLRAVDQLIRKAGITAVAVIARFPEDIDQEALQDYRQGAGVDRLAGAEAVISHLVVREFQIPCAHAPALPPLPLDESISPRSCAEELGYTFLPCVLVGLNRAPQYITSLQRPQIETIWAEVVNAIILPASACGGSAVLSLSQYHPLIIAVEDNQTTLNVYPEMLGLSAIRVKSYLEAIGILAGYRAGINPQTLCSSYPSLGHLAS